MAELRQAEPHCYLRLPNIPCQLCLEAKFKQCTKLQQSRDFQVSRQLLHMANRYSASRRTSRSTPEDSTLQPDRPSQLDPSWSQRWHRYSHYKPPAQIIQRDERGKLQGLRRLPAKTTLQ